MEYRMVQAGRLLALFAVVWCMAVSTRADEPKKEQEPTTAQVEAIMKRIWDKKATNLEARAAVTLNSVKKGTPAKATITDVLDGIPEGTICTPVILDFTVRTYYTDKTQVIRRVREGKVYKDAFGEWALLQGGARGQDETSAEPPQK